VIATTNEAVHDNYENNTILKIVGNYKWLRLFY
jgi:hypothetical protein